MGLRCPHCGEHKARRTPRSGMLSLFLRMASLKTYHCKGCLACFHRFRLNAL